MRTHYASYILGLVLIGWAGESRVFADPPQNMDLALVFHVDPTDPNSDVSMKVTLSLSVADVDENMIGWSIDHAEFSIPAGGDDWRSWDADQLTVLNTADGLWWVAHESVDDPSETEFTSLPTLIGLGVAQNAEDSDLVFFIDGTDAESQTPSTFPYSDHTAFGSYYFSDGVLVYLNDEDEPIEVGRRHDPQQN